MSCKVYLNSPLYIVILFLLSLNYYFDDFLQPKQLNFLLQIII